MRKIHKLLYSCFGFFMTLAYRGEANGAIVCTYSALSSCSNTGSTWYDSVANAHTAMLSNTSCSRWNTNDLCSIGFYVGSCYTDSSKTTKMSESKWDTDCSSALQVDCSSCGVIGFGGATTSGGSVAMACVDKSRTYVFQLCSSYQIDASGNPFAYGTTKQRSYTCTQTFSNGEGTRIMRQTDCFIPAHKPVVNENADTFEFTDDCPYTK